MLQKNIKDTSSIENFNTSCLADSSILIMFCTKEIQGTFVLVQLSLFFYVIRVDLFFAL